MGGCVDELVRCGANINLRNKHNDTPLHRALDVEKEATADEYLNDEPDIVRLILEAGGDVNLRDDSGLNALETANKLGFPGAANLIVRYIAAGRV